MTISSRCAGPSKSLAVIAQILAHLEKSADDPVQTVATGSYREADILRVELR